MTTIPSQHSIIIPGSLASQLPDAPGVYWWVALQSDGYETRPVPRATGPDPVGILYIGEGRSLKERTGKYVRTINKYRTNPGTPTIGDLKGQSANWCYLAYGAIKVYPRIALVWQETEDKEAARDLEANLIYKYRMTFAEMPPFNKGMYESYIPDIREWKDAGNTGNFYSKNSSRLASFTPTTEHYAPWAL